MKAFLFFINQLVYYFSDEGGRPFRFLENGDAPSRYRVVNYQRLDNGSYQWKEVGTYISKLTNLNFFKNCYNFYSENLQ